MVHADNSNFVSGLSKSEAYETLVAALDTLLIDNWVANLANTASLLWHLYQAQDKPQKGVNWSGFYLTDAPQQLVLGPFMGKVACQTIAFGSGVCGTAAATAQTQVVADVHSHPNHIACDSDTASEIVVPIVRDGKVLGVIDIDCTLPAAFDEIDAQWLEKVAEKLAPFLPDPRA